MRGILSVGSSIISEAREQGLTKAIAKARSDRSRAKIGKLSFYGPSAHARFYAKRSEEAFAAGKLGEGYMTTIGMVVHLADYESPACPKGWDTFWSFLAATEPDVLAFMDQEPESANTDEAQLEERCKRAGVTPKDVPAGSWLVRNGVFTARAYPLHILRAHTGQVA